MGGAMGDGFAYVDRRFCPIADAKISVLDPGFTRSDAVYDVVSVWKGGFFRLDEHIARFMQSCAGIQLSCPHTPAELKRILATCVARGEVAEGAYVSMTLTRGPYVPQAAVSRDIFNTVPNFIAYAIPYVWIAAPALQDKGLHLIVANTPRIPDACIDMHFKNYHWGDLTRSRFEARAAGADCAVLCSIEGYLTEGAGFNLFFAKGGRLFTPARNVLEGITRQSILDLAAELDIPLEAGDFTPAQLRAADEAFITSTAGGIMPIARVESRVFETNGPGPLSARLRTEYWRRRERGWLSTSVESILNTAARHPEK
jgi:branched-chain amino acid aminotransferase